MTTIDKLNSYLANGSIVETVEAMDESLDNLKKSLAEHKKVCQANERACPYEAKMEKKIEEQEKADEADDIGGKEPRQLDESIENIARPILKEDYSIDVSNAFPDGIPEDKEEQRKVFANYFKQLAERDENTFPFSEYKKLAEALSGGADNKSDKVENGPVFSKKYDGANPPSEEEIKETLKVEPRSQEEFNSVMGYLDDASDNHGGKDRSDCEKRNDELSKKYPQWYKNYYR